MVHIIIVIPNYLNSIQLIGFLTNVGTIKLHIIYIYYRYLKLLEFNLIDFVNPSMLKIYINLYWKNSFYIFFKNF